MRAGPAQKAPGVRVLFHQGCDPAAAQQSAQLCLLRGSADLCDDWGGHDRDDPGFQPDAVRAGASED